MKSKWTVIAALMLLLGVSAIAFVLFFVSKSQQGLERSINTQVRDTRIFIESLEDQLGNSYRRRIKGLLDYRTAKTKEKVLRSFEEQDRATLLRLCTPFLQLFQNENSGFATFSWVLPDNEAFLLVHNPKKFGFDVTPMRPDVVEANRSMRQISSYTVSPGGLHLSIVQPVLYEQRHLGVVQFGVRYTFILDALLENTNLLAAIVVDADRLSIVKKEKKPAIMANDYAIHTLDEEFFRASKDKVDWGRDWQRVSIDERQYVFVKARALADYQGRPVAQIFVALDISEQSAALRRDILLIVLLAVAVLISSLLILYFGYTPLFTRLMDVQLVEHLNEELEERVAQRTAALEASEDRYRSMFTNTHTIMYVIDPVTGRIIDANPAASGYYGYSHAELLTMNIGDINTLSKEEIAIEVERAKNEERSHFNFRHRLVDGTVTDVEAFSGPIIRDGKQLLFSIIHDVTEKKRMEDELLQSRKMEAMGTLAGGIAHDFNNILTAIIGYAELVRDELGPESQERHDIEQVLIGGKRAASLVAQILTFSRKSDHRHQVIKPQQVVEEAMEMIRASLPSTIEMVTEIDEACPQILADPTNLHQIIVNLCTNGAHAMVGDKGRLVVKLGQRQIGVAELQGIRNVEPGHFVVLSVNDNGAGMDSQTKARIFEPYFTTKELHKGSGLGLAVVHGIVSACAGFITVDSALGKGTTVAVHLPVVMAGAEDSPQDDVALAVPHGVEHLLVVDDEAVILELHTIILTKLGYRVTACSTPQQALAEIKADQHDFDLLLTDQTMPEMTGMELAHEVMKIRADLPIILCTGYSFHLSEQEALALGIRKFIQKPLEHKDMALAVREVLDGMNNEP